MLSQRNLADLITAVAYFVIPIFILWGLLTNRRWVVRVNHGTTYIEPNMLYAFGWDGVGYRAIVRLNATKSSGLLVLFCSFLVLCGMTYLLNFAQASPGAIIATQVVMALLGVATSIMFYCVMPVSSRLMIFFTTYFSVTDLQNTVTCPPIRLHSHPAFVHWVIGTVILHKVDPYFCIRWMIMMMLSFCVYLTGASRCTTSRTRYYYAK